MWPLVTVCTYRRCGNYLLKYGISHTIPYFQWIENRAKKALFVICLSQESFFCLSKRNLIRDISLKVIWQWKDFDRWSNSEKQLYVIEYWLNKFYNVLHEMKCTYLHQETYQNIFRCFKHQTTCKSQSSACVLM